MQPWPDHTLPTAADVDAAARRLSGIALHTPLITSPALDVRTGGRGVLHAETLQRTGPFKFRGAYNKRSAIPQAPPASGVVGLFPGHPPPGGAAGAALTCPPA